MTKRKRGCLIAFLLCLGLAVSYLAVVFFCDRQMTDYGRDSNYLSNRGYARALGLRDFRYDTVLQKIGSPVKQTVQQEADQLGNTLIDLEYPDFRVAYVEIPRANGSTRKALYLVTVWGESIKFGRKRIGIGSSREEVHKAYEKEPAISQSECKASSEDFPNLDEGYFGEDWSRILFSYDDAGFVTAIAYEPPSF